jgi:5-methylcytosine-specific restriction endonuclease McrA
VKVSGFEPPNRALRMYTQGWHALHAVRDDAAGFYFFLVIQSESDPEVSSEKLRRLGGRKCRRYVAELVDSGLATRAGDGIRLAEQKRPDDRWRYFGPADLWTPIMAVCLWEAPARVPLSRSTREFVIARDGRVCGICGDPIGRDEALDIDHVIPVALGGSDDRDNLQPSHASCNRSKGARLIPAEGEA